MQNTSEGVPRNETQNEQGQKENKGHAERVRLQQQREDRQAFSKAIEAVVMDREFLGTDRSQNGMYRTAVANHLGIADLYDQLRIEDIRPRGSNFSYMLIRSPGETSAVIGGLRFNSASRTLEYLNAAG